MNFKIVGSVLDNDVFDVTVNGITQVLDNSHRSLEYKLDENEKYTVEISQRSSVSNHSFLWIIIHLITLIFQGLRNIFLVNTESDWYQRVSVIRFHTVFEITPQDTPVINLSYTKSKYEENEKSYTLPLIKLSPSVDNKTDYKTNNMALKNALFSFLKRVISIIMTFTVFIMAVVILFLKDNFWLCIGIDLAVLLIGILSCVIFAILKITFYKKIIKSCDSLI